jgi:hypothetical protein
MCHRCSWIVALVIARIQRVKATAVLGHVAERIASVRVALFYHACVLVSFARLFHFLRFRFPLKGQKIFAKAVVLLVRFVVARRVLVFGQPLLAQSRILERV